MAPTLTVIDYKSLDKCCAIQCTGEECASFLGMDYDTLNRRLGEEGHGGFTDYFKKAACPGRISLRRKQFELANNGSVPMNIWLGKQWLDQKEPQHEDKSVSAGDKFVEAFSKLIDGLPQ